MKAGKKYTLPYKRKRQHKTDYQKRLGLIKSGKARVIVRHMLNNISVQITKYNPTGDQTIVSAHSRELLKYQWKLHRGNLPTAYLTGLLAGAKAKKQHITEAVLDLGLAGAIKGSAYFAAVKGLIDAGVHVPHSPDVLPTEDRLLGKNIVTYAQQTVAAGNTQFSTYKKLGVDITTLPNLVLEIKQKIIEQWK